MAIQKKVCKVCGEEYVACSNAHHTSTYRWQDVACCEEHGRQYLRDIMKSRGMIAAVEQATSDEAQCTVESEDTIDDGRNSADNGSDANTITNKVGKRYKKREA